MTRGQIDALGAIAKRLRRMDDTLRARLGNEQQQRRDAQDQLRDREDELVQADGTVAAHTERIDALLGGRRALRIDVLLGWQEQLRDAQMRRGERAAALGHAQEALGQIDATIAHTRGEIMRNDARAQQCETRLAKLHAEIARMDADQQDEEAEEMLGARRLANRASSTAARTGEKR